MHYLLSEKKGVVWNTDDFILWILEQLNWKFMLAYLLDTFVHADITAVENLIQLWAILNKYSNEFIYAKYKQDIQKVFIKPNNRFWWL